MLAPPQYARNDLQVLAIFFNTFISPYYQKLSFNQVIKYIRKSLSRSSPLFNSNNRLKIKQTINNLFYMSNLFIFIMRNSYLLTKKLIQSKLINFLFQNHLIKFSLNLNLANQQHLNYFSSFQ